MAVQGHLEYPGAGVHVHEVTVSGLAVVGAFIHIAGTGMALGL